jgi:hypothetical protein
MEELCIFNQFKILSSSTKIEKGKEKKFIKPSANYMLSRTGPQPSGSWGLRACDLSKWAGPLSMGPSRL